MKKFVLAFGFLAIISCKEDVKAPEYVIISGSIQNNVDMIAKINGFELDVEIPISENGSFLDTLNIANNGFYDLFIGRERATIYLEKGKNLSVVLNTNEFDETIAFTGDVAAENDYLAAKYWQMRQDPLTLS